LQSDKTFATDYVSYTLTPLKNSNEDEISRENSINKSNRIKIDNLYTFDSEIEVMDVRALAMKRFLLDKKSPLSPYAELIVAEADKYKMDWRILVSIAGVESNFCNITPFLTYNCWGWKMYSRDTWAKFKDLEEGIKHVTKRLALGYGGEGGSIDPFAIESVYCDTCGATRKHYWAKGVSGFMHQLDLYLKGAK